MTWFARLPAVVLVTALAFLATAEAMATPTACPEHFIGGEAPNLVNEALAPQAREICYTGFGLLHSGLSRTPLWAAEHLTRERMALARQEPRRGQFHADPNLPPDERAELADYTRSGYDRGHMAPAGDMPDEPSQFETFSLANMAPQNPALNRGLWERIESAVRRFAEREGDLYIVTGPIFQGDSLRSLHGRVLIPTGFFKALYHPGRNQAGAYVVDNAADSVWRPVSIAALQELIEIDVFPGLPPAVRETPMTLPEPSLRGLQR